MICAFNCVGVVEQKHEKHVNKFGDSVTITLLTNSQDRVNVVCTGRLTETVEGMLRVGDLVYVDGRIRSDRNVSLAVPKNALILFANFLTILPRS